ncbi:3-oxoacyl-ACP synthase III family protein [Wukongibacter baidiensis]
MIGLSGIGSYVPKEKISVDEIASHFDLERRGRIGVKNVPHESKLTATQMAVIASKGAMEDAGVTPLSIDLIMNTQASTHDYLMWQVSGAIQNELQAWNSTFLDIYQGCSGFVAGLVAAKRFLQADENIDTILVNTSEKWEAAIKKRIIGGYVFGEAGVAAIVQRYSKGNFILGHSMIGRGDLNDVSRMEIGAINLPEKTHDEEWYYYHITNIEKAKKVMIPINIDMFYKVGEEAIRNSGLAWEDINYMIFPNIRFGVFEKMIEKFKVDPKRTNLRYIEETGDCSTADALLNYHRMLNDGILQKGDNVLILSQGAGTTWAAVVIQV